MGFIQAYPQYQLGGEMLYCCQFASHLWTPKHERLLSKPEYRGLRSAVNSRKAEFVAGRMAAQCALSSIGIDDHVVAIGQHRAPVWPKGVCGSIAHTQRLAVSVARFDAEHQGLGVDVESMIDSETASAIKTLLASDEEYALYHRQLGSAAQFITLLFSAKESVFKAVYPQVQCYLEFHHAKVLSVTDNQLRVRVECSQLSIELDVYYQWLNTTLLTLAKWA